MDREITAPMPPLGPLKRLHFYRYCEVVEYPDPVNPYSPDSPLPRHPFRMRGIGIRDDGRIIVCVGHVSPIEMMHGPQARIYCEKALLTWLDYHIDDEGA
jgi:hypothetical protein